ncbi:hypothetical protein [Haloarchaeobius sp. DYHT-AS-18]|uniref:hypothetical protein n=1 Tax=Haloarchaeobius sp. DYHT-AS-18 TaxID=3446117 RepID=UPI003EBF567B
MTKPTRYRTKIEDGVFSVEQDEGWLEVGPMDGIVDLLGGETYTLEYTNKQASAAWLDTDESNTITIDVRESLAEMSFTDDIVSNLLNTPLEDGESGYPKRTELFADLFGKILDSKGNLDE